MPFIDNISQTIGISNSILNKSEEAKKNAERGALVSRGMTPSAPFDRKVRGQYFKGLSGLTAADRAEWDKANPDYSNSPEANAVFKNRIFMSTLKEAMDDNPDDENLKELYDKRKSLTWDDKDMFMARAFHDKADLDKTKGVISASYGSDDNNLVNQGISYMDSKSKELSSNYRSYFDTLSDFAKDQVLEDFDNLSKESSGIFAKYNNSDKLSLSRDEKLDIMADFYARADAVGQEYAFERLSDTYNDIVAKNQSMWELTVNTGAQFVDSMVGNMLRGAGMLGGLIGATFGYDKEKDEGYWSNILDNTINNDFTEWADRIVSTGAYSPEYQKELEEAGLQDNPILTYSKDKNSLFHSRVIPQLIGQYGFTTASTLMTLGGSYVVEGAIKGASWLAKAGSGARGLNATAKGVETARRLISMKNIANTAMAGMIGSVEGGMNAAETKKNTIESLEKDLENRFNDRAAKDIDNLVDTNPAAAVALLQSKGVDLNNLPMPAMVGDDTGKMTPQYTPEQLQYLKNLIKSNPDYVQPFKDEYAEDMENERKMIEEYARSAMAADFWINSAINGLMNTTLKASLNAPKVQKAIASVKRNLGRRFGAENPLDDMMTLSKIGKDTWNATVKKATKTDVILGRAKEAVGEMTEEYQQDLSSTFGEAFGTSQMAQYINAKYGGGEGQVAAEVDFFDSVMAGLSATVEAATGFEAIQSGVYGGLSTLIGGPNLNMNRNTKAPRTPGIRGTFDYLSSVSPITIRGAWTPLISNIERDELTAQRQGMVDRINSMLTNKDVQDAIFHLGGTSQWLTEMQKAIESHDEKAARDARLSANIGIIQTLGMLEGTAYYDAVITTLNTRAGFDAANLKDANSDESKALGEYKNDTQNTGGPVVSDEEAIANMQKKATDMLELINAVKEDTEEVEKLFGQTVDSEVKEALVYNRLMIRDYDKRRKQMDDELEKASDAISLESQRTGISEKVKVARAKYVNKNELQKQITEQEKTIAELDDILHDPTVQERKDKKLIKDVRRQAKAELEDMKESLQYLESDEVLSAADIMALDVQSRAEMLNNRDKYSQKQQNEIDRVNTIGNSAVTGFSNKVKDRAAVEKSRNDAMQQQYDMLLDSEHFSEYVNDVKTRYAASHIREANKSLLTYKEDGKSYEEFVNDVTEALSKDRFSSNVIWKMLEENKGEYFERFTNDTVERRGLIKEVNDLRTDGNKLSSDEITSLDYVLEYLQSKGIDIEDDDATSDALTAKRLDADTNTEVSILAEYLAKKDSPLGVNEAIPVFQDAMNAYKNHKAEKARNQRQVEVTPVSDNANNPPEITPEEESNEPPVEHKQYKDILGEEIMAEVEEVLNSSNLSDAKKNDVRDAINETFGGSVDIGNFISELFGRASSYDSRHNNGEDPEAAVIREVAQKIDEKKESIVASTNAKFNSPRPTTPTQAPTPRQTPVPENTGAEATRNSQNTEASRICSLDIDMILALYPNGAIADYIRNHHIVDYLTNHTLTRDTPILFITDSELNAAVEQDMRDKGKTFSDNSSALVAVVESNSGIAGAIEIDGKYYSPIAIMPATNSTSSGSARLAPIREAGKKNDNGVHLIKDNSGKPIEAIMYKDYTIARAAEGYNNTPNVAISTIISNTEKSLEKSKDAIIDEFIDGLIEIKTEKDGKEVSMLSYTQKTLKGNETRNRYVAVTPIHETVSPESGKTIEEVLNEGSGDIVNFNGRTKGFRGAIGGVLDILKEEGTKLAFSMSDNGVLSVEESSRANYNKIITDVSNKLNNWISLPSGWSYRVIPKSLGNEIVYDLVAINEGNTIYLTTLNPNNAADDFNVIISANEAIKNLIFDEDNKVRLTNEGKDSFAKWQINYNDVATANSPNVDNNNQRAAARNNVKSWIEDNLLRSQMSQLNYNPQYIEITTAASPESTPVTPPIAPAPTNNNAASPSPSPIENAVRVQGGTVEADSGIPIEGTPATPVSNIGATINERINKIVENSKEFKLDPSGKFYTGPGGKVYYRVTSIMSKGGDFDAMSPEQRIQIVTTSNGRSYHFNSGYWNRAVGDVRNANDGWGENNGLTYYKAGNVTIWFRDAIPSELRTELEEKIKEFKNKNSITKETIQPIVDFINSNIENSYKTVSTNIGTGIDNFVRDYVNESSKIRRLSDKELEAKYPNVSAKSLRALGNSLDNFIDKNRDLQFVTRDVTVHGEIEVVENGVTKKIPVAGTLDLLAFNKHTGEAVIFDMKTHRSDNTRDKRDKWQMQLSFYAALLKQQYGIEVSSMSIIPINVNYATPFGTSVFTIEDNESNQLTYNGHEFRGAEPKLQPIIPLTPVTPEVDLDRARKDGAIEGDGTTTNSAPAPIVESGSPVNSILGLTMDDADINKVCKINNSDAAKGAAEIKDNPVAQDEKYSWEKYADKLEEEGLNESDWNNKSQSEREQTLSCMGLL